MPDEETKPATPAAKKKAAPKKKARASKPKAKKAGKRKTSKPGQGKLAKAGKTSLVIWVDAKQGAFVKRQAAKAGISQAEYFRKKLGIKS